jgi:hypothetical protein
MTAFSKSDVNLRKGARFCQGQIQKQIPVNKLMFHQREMLIHQEVQKKNIYNCANCPGQLKKQQEHFDYVVHGKRKKEPNEDKKRNMQYGTENEINVVATLVGKILPIYLCRRRMLHYQRTGIQLHGCKS